MKLIYTIEFKTHNYGDEHFYNPVQITKYNAETKEEAIAEFLEDCDGITVDILEVYL